MALLLTAAAVGAPVVRERRWLMPALLLSATGDWALAIPWWTQSFVVGLAAFLLAHLCFLGALLPAGGEPPVEAAHRRRRRHVPGHRLAAGLVLAAPGP